MANALFRDTEFTGLEIDPRNAAISVLASGAAACGTAHSKHNHDDAVQHATAAAASAQARVVPLLYAVVRTTTEEVSPGDGAHLSQQASC